MHAMTIGQSMLAQPNGAIPDPHFGDVVLMLHMDGANGSTTFTDTTARHSISVTNGTIVSNAVTLFGGNCAAFDGTGDILSAADSSDWDFGTGDFTVEMEIYCTDLTGYRSAIGCASGTGYYPVNIVSEAGVLKAKICLDDHTLINIGSRSETISANTWYHVAISRTGTEVKWFLDGVEKNAGPGTTTTTSNPLFYAAKPLCIGNYSVDYNTSGGTTSAWSGYLRELRITKGYGRYTTSFSPPSARFPDS